jgi:cytochrome c-type biogenesis protein CcsB
VSATDLASFSNSAVAATAVVYLLALLSHILEWALGRDVEEPTALRDPALRQPALRQPALRQPALRQPALRQPALGEPALVAAPRAADSAPSRAAGSAPPSSDDRVDLWARVGVALTVLGWLLNLAAVVSRGLAAERAPWGNMYEFCLAGTLAVVGVYLLLLRRLRLSWLGLPVTAFAVVVLMLAVLVLYVPVAPLVPSLHSYWLVIHVSAAVVASGAFLVGAMTSVLFLLKDRAERRLTGRAERAGGEARSAGYVARLPESRVLDRIAYRVHAFAFPVWTFAALVAGPIWAEYAWGRYWGWDPKEVWAFITWVVYAAYLHARATAGWKGRAAAWIALAGAATLLFNFVGINYFFGGGSFHSYA